MCRVQEVISVGKAARHLRLHGAVLKALLCASARCPLQLIKASRSQAPTGTLRATEERNNCIFCVLSSVPGSTSFLWLEGVFSLLVYFGFYLIVTMPSNQITI